MKKFVLIILFSCSIAIYAQEGFYINPRFGASYSFNETTHERILGNDKYLHGISPDLIIDLLTHYSFKNNLVFESGIQVHFARDRAYIYYDTEIESRSGLQLGGKTYILIPLNIKYKINIGIKNFKLIPYTGVTYSKNFNEKSFYGEVSSSSMTIQNEVVLHEIEGTIGFYGLSNNNFLINSGLGFEYELRNKMALNLSFNYTWGNEDITKITVDMIENGNPLSGDIFYKDDKIYLSLGINLPIGYYLKGIN